MTELRLSVQPEQLTCRRGDYARIEVEVRNVSDVVEHYEAVVLGLPEGATATFEPAVAKLRPAEVAQLVATVTIEGEPLAGTYVLGVVVRSPHDSARADSGRVVPSRCEEVELVIPRSEAIQLEVTPTKLKGGALAHVDASVTNSGNAPVRVRLDGQDSTGQASFVFSPEWIDVPPTAEVPARASVRRRPPWTGQPETHEITIEALDHHAAGSADPLAKATASFEQHARLAPAAMKSARGLITMGVGVATILGAALLVREGADPTPVAADDGAAEKEEAGGGEESESPDDGGAGGDGADGEPVEIEFHAIEGLEVVEPDEVVPEELELAPEGLPPDSDESDDPEAFLDDEALAGADLKPIRSVEAVFDEANPGSGCEGPDLAVAIRSPGTANGFVHPALPDRPKDCVTNGLRVEFESSLTDLEVYLPRAAADANYSLDVELTEPGEDTLIDTPQRNVRRPPGRPDFAVSPNGSRTISSMTLTFDDPDVERLPVGISWMVVTPLSK